MRFFYTILFILVVIGLVSWLNYRLLSRLFLFYRAKAVRLAYLLFTFAAIWVVAYGLSKRPPFTVPEFVAFHYFVYGALAWFFGQLILLFLQPCMYAAHRLINRNPCAGDRRRALGHCLLAATPLFAFGTSTYGVYESQTAMTVQRYSLVMADLPAELNGFKIAQVSDTHLGPYFDLARLDTVIQMLRAEKPDMVVITGDFADDLNLLQPAIERFNDLQPSIPYGIYFCYGNHDYYRDIHLLRTQLHHSRIVPLENESALIVPGPRPFYLLGVEYPWSDGSYNTINVSPVKRQQLLAAANQNVPPNAFKVLIAHHPDFLFDGFAARIPLVLTGHTHGGQVAVGSKSILSSYAYMRGLYQEDGVYGYVSSGAGQWFPFRLGIPPEISVFTLHN